MSLNDLSDPQAVRQAMAEFDRVGRTAFLQRYGFGKARDYVLQESGRSYDSKAIVGAAFGYQFPDRGPLKSADFSGGENTVQRKLEELGFSVERIGEAWSRPEVERTVGEYLDMLALEARGTRFNKSARNEELRRHLMGRTKASVELKHQNISAILDELGLPFIQGYKPRANVQSLLREVVVQAIRSRHDELTEVMDDFQAVHRPAGPDYRGVLVTPPPPAASHGPSARTRVPRKFDHAERDDRNRTLGREGENWTVGYERFRLGQNHRHDLAGRIDWVAETQGDGTGYDIASFDEDGAVRYIEVKTTNGGAATPFVVTSNELAFSIEVGPAFHLYRLFAFSSAAQLFILRGALADSLALAPLNYRARVASI